VGRLAHPRRRRRDPAAGRRGRRGSGRHPGRERVQTPVPELTGGGGIRYGLGMSRYEYLPEAWPGHFRFAVGWDPAFETYFAQVMDDSIGRDDDCVIVWLGALDPHYPHIDELMQAVYGRIRGRLPEVTLTEAKKARLMKDKKTDYDGNAPHSTYPKSWATPPLYVLRTAASCPECRRAMHVYVLGCAAFRYAEDRDPVEDFHFLRQISRLPKRVLGLLPRQCPGFRLGREAEGTTPYLMNHCRCGARLDDDYLCGDVGAAFWPDTPDGYGAFELHRLAI